MILEWDIFYPLPSTWRKPKKPVPPPPPPPPPPVEPEKPLPEIIEDHHHDDSHSHHSGEIWIPSGGWTSDVVKTLSGYDDNSADKRNWNRRQVGHF